MRRRRYMTNLDKWVLSFRHYVLGQRLWYKTWIEHGNAHIVPVLDMFTHEAAPSCLCQPVVELHQTPEGDEWLTTHHSFDARKQVDA
jgi:hypothetical protein